MSGPGKKRVAIYTRKSSEEGLEQEFNSLHAQREACEAYVISQRELGWKTLATAYDDGGLSGGSMERPALHRLLEDVRANRIDVIIVYKIDRLTRSLMDFARIVAVFDAHDVSFVSVTQQFNTATSMGRLTLNMLLSFAQFEREVTAERIRDKFAASKRKGMWMGGVVPLGYDVRDRKLVINHCEAEAVRWLYRTYLELRSVRKLKTEADRYGIVSKRRTYVAGKNLGGRPLKRGHLYCLLSNPLYVGKICHKGKIHDGQHEAIIDHETFDSVQVMLRENTVERRSSNNGSPGHLLTGVLFDETGDRLSPSHASKKGVRYRYYVSHRLIQDGRTNGDGWRLPAEQLETIIMYHIAGFLSDRRGLLRLLDIDNTATSAGAIRAIIGESDKAVSVLKSGSAKDRSGLLRKLIDRITVGPERITIAISPAALRHLLASTSNEAADQAAEPIILEVPAKLRRRGIEAKFVLADAMKTNTKPDQALVNLLADANHCLKLLTSGNCQSISELSARTGFANAEISRILPLAFLAPKIVRPILEGRQPVELTARTLKRTKPLPLSWHEQSRRLGFDADHSPAISRKK